MPVSKGPKLPPPWKPSTRPPKDTRLVVLAYHDGHNQGTTAGFFRLGDWHWASGYAATPTHTIDAWQPLVLPPHPFAAAKKRRAK